MSATCWVCLGPGPLEERIGGPRCVDAAPCEARQARRLGAGSGQLVGEGFNLSVTWDQFEKVRQERDRSREANDRLERVVYGLNCRVAELKNAIARAMQSGEDAGILGADAFGILQGVVHDGIAATPCAGPDHDEMKKGDAT